MTPPTAFPILPSALGTSGPADIFEAFSAAIPQKRGIWSTIIIFGTAAPGGVSQKEADRAVEK